jgi:AcrR family transcriptional regulator
MSSTTVSPRGTRPRDRRAQIRAAATRLFYEHGYEQVSVADVAASVNVGPSALYRHFAGKSDMLFEAIDETVTAFGGMVADLPSQDLDGVALTCARTAMAYRPLGVLWQRESRNLPEHQQAHLRGRLREAGRTLAETLADQRPDLTREQAEFLAACGVNAMSSISFHRIRLTPERFEQVLTELSLRILEYRFPDSPVPEPPGLTVLRAETRREQIADAAASLFARHGFDAVSIDDIGAAVGIAGPSIYNHFESKQDLLFASLGRGYAVLLEALADALETEAPPAEKLRRVSDSYVDLTVDHGDLVTNLIAENRNLGEEYRDAGHEAQHGYINQWVELVLQLRPTEDTSIARLKVQAAQMMANSMARTPYLSARPGFRRDLREICWFLLA